MKPSITSRINEEKKFSSSISKKLPSSKLPARKVVWKIHPYYRWLEQDKSLHGQQNTLLQMSAYYERPCWIPAS